eukprot:TRINITY_DN13351_c0_g1_i1.p1 TRINITY_DN13351_c0_g1~~TRINITY_DN13351_c0_g1_i1.p1  ORF type:complete len:933 (+),score=417.67 TRINITY_DN13351_c0_g1_i1:133-2931(+)
MAGLRPSISMSSLASSEGSLSRRASKMSMSSHADDMDEATREHFQFLQQSIGQNFISVLNDPTEKSDKGRGAFGGWFEKAAPAGPDPNNHNLNRPLAKIPPASPAPIEEYVAALRGNYEAWVLAKKEGRKRRKDGRASPPPGPEAPGVALPPEFAAPDFQILEHPDVLHQIMPDVGDPFTSQLFLTRLQYYLKGTDTLLFAKVKERSPQFFVALQKFTDLKTVITRGISKAGELRGSVDTSRRASVSSSLTILQLQRRKANQLKLRRLCAWVASVRDGQAEVQRALEERKFTAIMDRLDEQAAGAGSQAQLERVICLKLVRKELDRAKHICMVELHAELLNMLLGVEHVVDPSQKGSSQSIQWPDQDSSAPGHEAAGEAWRAKLLALATPLLSTAKGVATVKDILQSFRKRVYDEVKRCVADSIVVALRALAGDNSLTADEVLKPARQRALSAQNFNFVLDNLYAAVFFLYRRVHRVADVLADAIAKASGAKMSELDRAVLLETIADARANVIKMIQKRVVRMFEVRQEEHANYTFNELHNLLLHAFRFIFKLEGVVVGDGGAAGGADPAAATSSFRATLITQARTVFKKYHERQQTKLLQILQAEQWQAEVDIDVSFQDFCDHMTDASPEAVERARLVAVDRPDGGKLHTANPRDGSNPKLSISGRYYVISQSVLMLLRTLYDYEQYVCSMPFLAHDVVQRIHDLLKCYDGQTAGLILGAGARETAGIGTITPAHLAVSAQCLTFFAAFAPLFKARLAAVLPAKGQLFLKNIDRFAKEATDHRNEFYVKIVLMVREGVNMMAEWRADQWLEKGSGWITGLLKDAARLLKKAGLERILEKQQLRVLFYPLFHAYHNKIAACTMKMKAIHGDAALLKKVKGDILNYKANVENFGFSVVVAATARDLSDAEEWGTAEALPDPADAVLALYLPPK